MQIADFGWAKRLSAGKSSVTVTELPRISTRWLALECLDKFSFSEKSDVWAMAVTMWECYTYGQTPFEQVHFLQVPKVVREGLRLERPLNLPLEGTLLSWRPPFCVLCCAVLKLKLKLTRRLRLRLRLRLLPLLAEYPPRPAPLQCLR